MRGFGGRIRLPDIRDRLCGVTVVVRRRGDENATKHVRWPTPGVNGAAAARSEGSCSFASRRPAPSIWQHQAHLPKEPHASSPLRVVMCKGSITARRAPFWASRSPRRRLIICAGSRRSQPQPGPLRRCPQSLQHPACANVNPAGSATITGNENCLRLNVWTPDPDLLPRRR